MDPTAACRIPIEFKTEIVRLTQNKFFADPVVRATLENNRFLFGSLNRFGMTNKVDWALKTNNCLNPYRRWTDLPVKFAT